MFKFKIMQKKFYLAEKLPPYIFASIYQLKQAAISRGVEILDFGMGNPDSAPPDHVMERLAELSQNPKLFGYSVTGGLEILKKSVCEYYARRFNVELDYRSESLISIGAKEGITSLATAISDDQNYLCLASPSYPIHTFAFIISRSSVRHLKAISGADFLNEFKIYVEGANQKPQAIIVNFPCNPTGEIVGLDFYQELVSFCKKYQIYIISDLAYCELYFDEENKPHSVLEVKGAKELAIEFSSVSKSFSMAGARIGFACGNKDLISALHKIKSYLDYGSFEPLQIVAAEALSVKSDDYLKNLRALYKNRAEFFVDLLQKELAWKLEKPKASMFLWAKLPAQFSSLSSFEFCRKMIDKAGVVMSPGSSFGKGGEGFVRISLIHDEERMRQAILSLKQVS